MEGELVAVAAVGDYFILSMLSSSREGKFSCVWMWDSFVTLVMSYPNPNTEGTRPAGYYIYLQPWLYTTLLNPQIVDDRGALIAALKAWSK